jgi:hypothetical protein
VEGRERLFWYPPWYNGYYYTPTFWCDGRDSASYSLSASAWRDTLFGMVHDRNRISSPLEMSLWVEYGAHGDSGTAHLEIAAVAPITYDSLALRLAVVEDGLLQGTRIYDQVLRDYLGPRSPNGHLGYAITLAQGDTILWDEDFIMDAAWNENKCRIMAFVQEGRVGGSHEREVLQAIQAPVVIVPPDQVTDLTITLVEDDLFLQWSPVTADTSGNPIVVDSYYVYRDTVAFFGPGSDPFDGVIGLFFTDTTGVVGDPLVQYYYAVTAVAGGKEAVFSSIVGEFNRNISNTE